MPRPIEKAPECDASAFRLLVESASDVMYRADREGRLLYANPAAARLTGYSVDELVGMRFTDLVRPDHRDLLAALLARQLDEESENSYAEFPVVTRAGEELWLGQNAQLVREEGAVAGVHAIARDVTARRQMEAALRESEERFRQLAEQIDACFWLIDAVSNELLYASPSFERVWGAPRADLLSTPEQWITSIHPDDRERVVSLLPRRRDGDFEAIYRIVRPDGEVRWIRDRSFLYSADEGRVLRVAGLAEDITERQAAEEASQHLAALSRENPNPVLQCDREGEPEHVNPAAVNIARELALADVKGLLPANHAELVAEALRGGHEPEPVEVSIGDRIFSWSYRPDPRAGVVYLFAVDITARRLMEEQLRHDALHDALTGLPNRLLFMERLAHAIARSRRRDGYLFAVLFLDLDRFKVINDSLGHQVGDDLLVLIAQRLGRCLREEDTVARFGGDEFAILLEQITGISDATRVAERIQAELSAPVNLGGLDVFTSASIGIALSSSAYERPEYLLRNADMAMYRAKGAGQARFEVFDRAMHAQALARLQLETDLRRALERNEFVLHYQPIITLETGEICGVEALVRWAHPERGFMSPDQFIPVAEETGLILPIGKWVLREACRRAMAWRTRFGAGMLATVGVNLSAKQFSQADLAEQIRDALRSSGLPGNALRLEITESAVMENADAAIVLLRHLKALGIQIALDDFGTGYSSLSYLHRFPLDAVKIDRSFVARIDSEDRSTRLVETVLTLARALGVSAVAEGIETEEQAAALVDLKCDFAQGYHFARPLDPEALESLLAGNQG